MMVGAAHLALQRLAWGRYARAIKDGTLIRASCCERCGSAEQIEGHHPDYSKPLDVEWLCRPCHMAYHAKERSEETARRRQQEREEREKPIPNRRIGGPGIPLIAKQLGMHERTVRTMFEEQVLPRHKVGRRTFCDLDVCERILLGETAA